MRGKTQKWVLKRMSGVKTKEFCKTDDQDLNIRPIYHINIIVPTYFSWFFPKYLFSNIDL